MIYTNHFFKETHILSFVSPSSQSLANLRASLSGEKWENYLDLVGPFVENVRVSAGNATQVYNAEQFYPIGQVWSFKVKSKHVPQFSQAFAKLMQTFEAPGFVGLANVTHGISNGENLLIYGTYPDLNSAFTLTWVVMISLNHEAIFENTKTPKHEASFMSK